MNNYVIKQFAHHRHCNALIYKAVVTNSSMYHRNNIFSETKSNSVTVLSVLLVNEQ